MRVRPAKISDVKTIYSLVSDYAEQDKMLSRSLADIYENLQTFLVVESGAGVIGCCALQIIWSDLAEIKSLAVEKQSKGRGGGIALVNAAIQHAKKLGIPKVFALTLEPAFFHKLGFETVEKNALPMKVWSDCAKCPKQQSCDETAVIKTLPPED